MFLHAAVFVSFARLDDAMPPVDEEEEEVPAQLSVVCTESVSALNFI